MLQTTTAQKKIAKLSKRIRIIYGGTSASKTFSILPFLIHYAVTNDNLEISVVAETIPQLRRGALKDFLKIMQMIGYYNDNQYNKSTLKYTFNNGSYIEFFSADNPDKLRGARRDILFVNECNNIDWESYYQLAIRTNKVIFLDYNPTHEFWVDTELAKDPDADFLTLTYKDNEALSPSIVKEIEKAKEKAKTSSYWENWWRVYGLGLKGNLEGLIFDNWKQLDKIPPKEDGCIYLCTGLDLGFANDPTAAVDVYKYKDGYILDEIIYQKGLFSNQIADKLKQGNLRRLVYCDHDIRVIEELKRYGVNVFRANKVEKNLSIELLQSNEISMTKESVNLIKEQRGYVWEKTKSGQTINTPIGINDHLMDATRYAAVEVMRKEKTGKKYFIV